MARPEIRQHLDYAFRLLREEVRSAQEMGIQAEAVLKALGEEERLPKGLRDALAEAQKHFGSGTGTLARTLEAHMGDVREHAPAPAIAMDGEAE